MKLRLQTHIECIYFCKWIAAGLSIAFIVAFSLESNIELKITIKQWKGHKFFLTRFYACVNWIRPTTREGENRAFVSAPKFSGIILDYIKKVMLIFGFSESPWTNYWLHALQTDLLVSPCFGLFTTAALNRM